MYRNTKRISVANIALSNGEICLVIFEILFQMLIFYLLFYLFLLIINFLRKSQFSIFIDDLRRLAYIIKDFIIICDAFDSK